MRTLADLFDDRRTSDEPASAVGPDDERERFEALVGPPRTEARRGTPRDDTMALVTMVDRAAHAASPTRTAGSAAPVKLPKRGTKRVDWLNVSAAVLAAALVTGVAIYGGIQLANSSPAASAVRALTVDEATLVNSESAAGASIDRIEELIAEARGRADEVDPALAAVEEYVDEDARRAALDAVAALRERLDALELPTTPEVYARPDIDTESLGAVGAQIDAVRARADELDGLNEQIRAARAEVAELREQFDAALLSFGAGFPAVAETEVEENIQADQVFIDAVTEGAADIVTRQEAGETAADQIVAFPGLVDELRADHARVIAAIIAEQERLAEIARQAEIDRQNANNNGGGGGFVPSNPDPVTPVEPEPQPTDPAPQPDPEPSQPAEPDPVDPVDPVPGDGTSPPSDDSVG